MKTTFRQFDVAIVNYRATFDTIKNSSFNSSFTKNNSNTIVTSSKNQFVEINASRAFHKFRDAFSENFVSSFEFNKFRTRDTIDISTKKIIYKHLIKFTSIDMIIFTEINIQRICDRVVQNYVERHSQSFDSFDSFESFESIDVIEETTDSF